VQITNTAEAAAVRSKREGVLWLWKAHNEVNSRLKQVTVQPHCMHACWLHFRHEANPTVTPGACWRLAARLPVVLVLGSSSDNS
jgi:hypothetical protein